MPRIKLGKNTPVQGDNPLKASRSNRRKFIGPEFSGDKAKRGVAHRHHLDIWMREGWLYSAAVLDLYSRRIIGWAWEERMTKGLACPTLEMATYHSGRGSQYASGDYQPLLKTEGMEPSRSRKGNGWDNAPMESFFHTLKVALIYPREYRSREEARRQVIESMEMF